jgi:hypothetical protein
LGDFFFFFAAIIAKNLARAIALGLVGTAPFTDATGNAFFFAFAFAFATIVITTYFPKWGRKSPLTIT